MKKLIYYLFGFLILSTFTSCKKEVIRGTQIPKNVANVEGLGKIGSMVKYYDFRDKFLACWDYGFSEAEDFGRWCVGEKGFLIFQVRKNATVTLKIDFAAFVSDKHRENRIKVSANGIDCGEIVLTEDKTVYLNFDQRHITKNNAVELELTPLNPISPKELGINNSEEKIGFGLKSVTLWAYYPVE